MHTSTLGVACTERINTTTVRTSFNGGGVNTALAFTTASVNKPVNATSTPRQQRWWTRTALLRNHRHRLHVISGTFSSQLHRVLRLLRVPVQLSFHLQLDRVLRLLYCYCWRFIVASGHAIDNQLLELKAPVLQGHGTAAARRGQHGHYYANSCTFTKTEQRLLQQ